MESHGAGCIKRNLKLKLTNQNNIVKKKLTNKRVIQPAPACRKIRKKLSQAAGENEQDALTINQISCKYLLYITSYRIISNYGLHFVFLRQSFTQACMYK